MGYTAYVGLQAAFRLLCAGHSIGLLRDETDERLIGAAAQRGERTVQPLRTMLGRRWTQLRRWIVATVVAYVAITLLAATLGILGPRSGALR